MMIDDETLHPADQGNTLKPINTRSWYEEAHTGPEEPPHHNTNKTHQAQTMDTAVEVDEHENMRTLARVMAAVNNASSGNTIATHLHHLEKYTEGLLRFTFDFVSVVFHYVSFALTCRCLACQRLVVMFLYDYSFLGPL